MASTIEIPAGGDKITIKNGVLQVPDNPVIPFVEGDGTGRDIWRASKRVFDAAVENAYRGKKSIAWAEVYAGEKAFNKFSSWLPEETIDTFQEYLVGIKGPLTTPVGGGIRSLPGGAFPRETSGICRYGGISGKHRRYIHRHRV
jgi:isocitrate dehydrogenase